MTPLDVRPPVAAALAKGGPVVALESTVVAHGLPWPENLEVAHALQAAVREAGAVPATIGLVDGRIVAGLSDAELERFARGGRAVAKVSRRDLAPVLARRALGATTVAGTMIGARLAGIPLMATGGLGGVHRNAIETFDISSDLAELARTPVAVVCSGAKSILDLPRTLELLEGLGVPVVGYGTGGFPAFYSRDSGLPLPHRVESPAEAAALIDAQRALALGCGLVLANPPPAETALEHDEVERLLTEAEVEAAAQGVAGPAVTPFLLGRLHQASAGRTLDANRALLVANARLAGQVAVALSNLPQDKQEKGAAP